MSVSCTKCGRYTIGKDCYFKDGCIPYFYKHYLSHSEVLIIKKLDEILEKLNQLETVVDGHDGMIDKIRGILAI